MQIHVHRIAQYIVLFSSNLTDCVIDVCYIKHALQSIVFFIKTSNIHGNNVDRGYVYNATVIDYS